MNIFYIKFCFKFSCRLRINFKLPVQRSKSVLSLNVCHCVFLLLDPFLQVLSSAYPYYYCAFHKHANSEVQKPTDVCVFAAVNHLRGVLGNRRFL